MIQVIPTVSPPPQRNTRGLVETRTGLLIGAAYIPPSAMPGSEGEAVQAALLGLPIPKPDTRLRRLLRRLEAQR